VRARTLLAGLAVIAAACSGPADEPIADEAFDERGRSPDLALSPRSDNVPVASDIEMHQPEVTARPAQRVPTARPQNTPEPMPEPLSSDRDGDIDAAPAPASSPAPVASHVHPKAADPEDAVSEPIEGGGKPRGVSTGLGPVPDRNWGDTGGIIDDPHPLPGPMEGIGGIGRDGAVIVRGGIGGVHDDCRKHPSGGTVALPSGGRGNGPDELVNDRDPRRGALINDRAPRTSRGPSLTRGGGFPRGGIR
jgi:hypothetical protein